MPAGLETHTTARYFLRFLRERRKRKKKKLECVKFVGTLAEVGRSLNAKPSTIKRPFIIFINFV